MTDWLPAHWLSGWIAAGLVAAVLFARGGPVLSNAHRSASLRRRALLALIDLTAVALFFTGGPVALLFLLLHALDER